MYMSPQITYIYIYRYIYIYISGDLPYLLRFLKPFLVSGMFFTQVVAAVEVANG